MSETLTQPEFDERLAAGELVLSLVGMSNVGKSYWSEKLEADAGFEHLCCDGLIEEELGSVLTDLGYSGGIADVAKWMGQPYDPQFAANQQRYFDLETQTMRFVADICDEVRLTGDRVVDTTGSVVHTDPQIRQRLTETSTVVYLEATPEMQQEMFELYIANPKPVVWQDLYTPETTESPKDALARCYPKLLAYRSERYRDMAHVTISRDVSLSLGTTADFLNYVREALPAA